MILPLNSEIPGAQVAQLVDSKGPIPRTKRPAGNWAWRQGQNVSSGSAFLYFNCFEQTIKPFSSVSSSNSAGPVPVPPRFCFVFLTCLSVPWFVVCEFFFFFSGRAMARGRGQPESPPICLG